MPPASDQKDPPRSDPSIERMGPIGKTFSVHLQRVDYRLRRAVDEAVQGPKLRTGAIAGLSFIVANPGAAQNDIVNATAFDKSAVNAIVNDLERLGWATRRKCDDDRRRHELFATDAGAQALGDIVDRMVEAETKLLSGLSDADRDRLIGMLDGMCATPR